jgi:predicted metal-dependent hydrolase
MIAVHRGGGFDAHYAGYFDCFNRGLFYEAHDVLEELWLAEGKAGANYGFYKGLIQLAGAFVHLQKQRLRPAAALFKLAQANLRQYPATHERLDVAGVLGVIADWLARLEESGFAVNPLDHRAPPRLAPDAVDH